MKVFALKTCDTCRKAIRELTAAGQSVDVTDVRADGVSHQDLTRFYKAFGDDLVNKRSTTWRGLSEAERGRDSLDLLTEHPTLMKRPVVEADGQLYLGWTAQTRAALLG